MEVLREEGCLFHITVFFSLFFIILGLRIMALIFYKRHFY